MRRRTMTAVLMVGWVGAAPMVTAQGPSQRADPPRDVTLAPAPVPAVSADRDAPDTPPSLAVLIAMARAQAVLMQAELSITKEWREYREGEAERERVLARLDADRAARLAKVQARANALASQRAALALQQRADAEAKAAGLAIDWTTGRVTTAK